MDENEFDDVLSVLIADQQSALQVDMDEIRRIVLTILHDAEFRTGQISVAMVDDPAIHEINRQFLEHDYPTDVISFLLDSGPGHIEGEIVVSTETAIDRASEFDWQPIDELLLYVVHGTLHLVGYDDHGPDEKAEMRRQERHYMKQLGRDVLNTEK